MPDPKTLKVGDEVRFTTLPEEWSDPRRVLPEDVEFMKSVIATGKPYRIAWLDERGTPWVKIQISGPNGLEHHTWGILETTGWIKLASHV